MRYEKIIVYAKDMNSSLSLMGQPNSITDLIDTNGEVKQRRIYGPDGMAIKDIDTSDHKKPKFHPMGAHKHVYDYSKKNPHGVIEKLDDEELLQNKDIILSGRNYKDIKNDEKL